MSILHRIHFPTSRTFKTSIIRLVPLSLERDATFPFLIDYCSIDTHARVCLFNVPFSFIVSQFLHSNDYEYNYYYHHHQPLLLHTHVDNIQFILSSHFDKRQLSERKSFSFSFGQLLCISIEWKIDRCACEIRIEQFFFSILTIIKHRHHYQLPWDAKHLLLLQKTRKKMMVIVEDLYIWWRCLFF